MHKSLIHPITHPCITSVLVIENILSLVNDRLLRTDWKPMKPAGRHKSLDPLHVCIRYARLSFVLSLCPSRRSLPSLVRPAGDAQASAGRLQAGERDAEDVSSLILRRVEERGESLEGEGDMGGSRGAGARPGSDGDRGHGGGCDDELSCARDDVPSCLRRGKGKEGTRVVHEINLMTEKSIETMLCRKTGYFSKCNHDIS